MGEVRSLGMRRSHSLILALRDGVADAIKSLLPLVPNHAVLRGMLDAMESENLVSTDKSGCRGGDFCVVLTPLENRVPRELAGAKALMEGRDWD